MSIQISNRRNQLRRSTVTGTRATVPGSGATSIYLPDETWYNSDIMVGELFLNTVDSVVQFRDDIGIHTLGYSGMTSWEPTYIGNSLMYMRINSGETDVEYVNVVDTKNIVSMDDWTYGATDTGQTGYSVTLDSSGTGFTLTDVNQTFIELTDTFTGYTGNALNLLRVNSGETAIENYDGATQFVDLTSNQIIEGNKVFNDDTTFNEVVEINNSFILSGLTENITINDIDTSAMTSVNNNTLATTQSIYDYINTIIFGTGTTGNFVTIDTAQNITGAKKFLYSLTQFNDILAVDVEVNKLTINNNVLLDLTSYQYWGDSTTDGSYRQFINVSGDLVIEKRVAGVWVFRMAI